MKRLFLVILPLLLFLASPAQTKKTYYTCVMHPEIKTDRPGSCPKCGMQLVKKTEKVAAPGRSGNQDKKAAEPKHEFHQDHLSDPPVVKPKVDTQQKAQQNTKVFYTCVMHPEIHTDRPGTCPKCGMTLIRKTNRIVLPDSSHDHPHNMQMDRDDQNLSHRERAEVDSAGDAAITGSSVSLQAGKTVVYHLYVTDTMVNYTGKKKHAYGINGSLPAPALFFTEGDTAEIYLHNRLKKETTSLHWHGVILPNRFDGVPYLTTARIGPGETHLYKFRVVQNGTYWYHSHTALQEQQGLYGALIFRKRDLSSDNAEAVAPVKKPTDAVIVLSEWSDENPSQTQRRFRTGNDWFSIKKRSTQSYAEAIREGYFSTKLLNEWKRMKAMDVSDDWYQKFLVNGQPEMAAQQYKAGDKVNLHVVNAGASTYFWLTFAGGKIAVVGNDGNELQPVPVDRLIIAPAETYDLVVTILKDRSYELRATSEDRTGAASLWLGSGAKVPAPRLQRLKYFEGMKMMNGMMKTNGSMKDMGMNMSLQQMDMNVVMYPEITGAKGDVDTANTTSTETNPAATEAITGEVDSLRGSNTSKSHDMHMGTMESMEHAEGSDIVTLNYGMMKAPYITALPDGPARILHFHLTGNMNRYVWTLDNKTVNESDRILINQGEKVRIILTNNSMMRHPMHLHGHDFRVLNGQGDYAPLKNVIDIMPMETDTIEFAANQEGNWFFHCHILYHMMAGMGRVFTYNNSPANPELPDTKMAEKMFRMDNNMRHLMVRAGLESNGSDGEAMLSTNRYALATNWRLGLNPHHGYESETYFGRYMGVNQWLFPYIGFDYHRNKKENMLGKNLFGQYSNQNNRKTFTAGIQYTTPWLMLADIRVDGKGKFRFQLGREDIPVTNRLRLSLMGNTDKEYMGGLRFILSKWMAVSTHYDSDMGYGAGVTITY